MTALQEVAGPTKRVRSGRLGLTLLACALVTSAFTVTMARLTAGFEQWTFESLRRQEASQGTMMFPTMDLVDAQGRPLRLPAGGTGEVMVVDFVYTGCESVCRALGAEFFQAQQQVRREGQRVRLLSISIDPANDTPQALAAYGARHRADPSVWTIAAPRTVDEGRQARRALGVIAVADGSGGFAHNGAIHVVDPRGRVVGIFDTANWQPALALAAQLAARRP
ncbi:MAG: SCO family protein [Burkholderiales bacterium]|nr:SCO family protein [Burkholderiales bacterium]